MAKSTESVQQSTQQSVQSDQQSQHVQQSTRLTDHPTGTELVRQSKFRKPKQTKTDPVEQTKSAQQTQSTKQTKSKKVTKSVEETPDMLSNLTATNVCLKYLCEPSHAPVEEAKSVRTIAYRVVKNPDSHSCMVLYGACVYNKVDKHHKSQKTKGTEEYDTKSNCSENSETKVFKTVDFNKENNTQTAIKRLTNWPVIFKLDLVQNSELTMTNQIESALIKKLFDPSGGCSTRKEMNMFKVKTTKQTAKTQHVSEPLYR